MLDNTVDKAVAYRIPEKALRTITKVPASIPGVHENWLLC